jgi:undecaprenyl-diphosphatase
MTIVQLTLVQIIVLAIIQGMTEFLPVSSSAHLILGSRVFSWPDQGLVFDVATHLGTLLAVLVYFRKDLADMFRACLRTNTGHNSKDEALARRMVVMLIVASIPALLVGALTYELVENYLRDMRVIAWATIGFGLLLWWADTKGGTARQLKDLKINSAVLIGLAQMLALIPGTSRSGITITVGRMLGYDADSAARFSFLLSIPIIGAAGAYGAVRVAAGQAAINWSEFLLAVVLSAVTGWICISIFLALLKRVGLLPFVFYRLFLGLVLLYLLY